MDELQVAVLSFQSGLNAVEPTGKVQALRRISVGEK